METLEQRVAAIEQSNRRWKRSTVALGVIALAVIGIAADEAPQIPDLVIARKFVAVNERGEPVAILGHTNNVGIVGVSDSDGSMLFAASADDEGQGIVTTYDATGHKLVTLGASRSGVGHIATYQQGRMHSIANRTPVTKSADSQTGR